MSVNDPHIVFTSLLTRKLSGELTPEELRQFSEALSQDPDLELQMEEFKKVWDSVEKVSGRRSYDMDTEWHQFRGKLRAFKRPSLLYYTSRVAAILLAGLIFSLAWIYANRMAGTTLVAAGEEQVEVVMEDGTRVVLNRDSKIRYRKQFPSDSREVRLAGEAWFDVASDSTRPFVIDAGAALVEVLGTSFNVNAYETNPKVEITVASGVVSVSPKQDRNEQMILRAGNSGSYNILSSELQLVKAYNPNNLSWKTRELYFEDTPLKEVADLIGKVYNVKLEISNPGLASCPITVSFSDQSLESVLNVLEVTLDLQVFRSGNIITLDGTACIE